MNKCVCVCAAIVAASVATSAFGGLALSQSGPLPQVYANGGGSGFGGTLGAGSITMGSTSGNLDVSFTPGNALNDIVVIMLDTRNGGLADFEMNDTADGGRAAVSSPALNGVLNHALGMNTYAAGANGGTADFGLAIGNFGSVLFELTTGSLNFLQFNGAQNISIPFASIGSPSVVDWFAYYTAGSQFLSNESLPASAGFNGGGNPGFDTGAFSVEHFNRYLVPAPTSAALLGLGGLIAGRRRR